MQTDWTVLLLSRSAAGRAKRTPPLTQNGSACVPWAQVMLDTLEFLRITHGSVSAYLAACGFDPAAQTALAASLAPDSSTAAANGRASNGVAVVQPAE